MLRRILATHTGFCAQEKYIATTSQKLGSSTSVTCWQGRTQELRGLNRLSLAKRKKSKRWHGDEQS